MSERASWWSLTINNPTDECREALKNPPEFAKEIWYQDEIGAQGTLHIQGCLHSSQIRFSTIKDWLPRARIEKARNKDALQNYCKKSNTSVEGTFVYYNQRPRNEIIEQPEAVPHSLQDSLLNLASFIHEDEYADDPQDQYKLALNRLVCLKPDLVEKLTANRVSTAWRFTSISFLHLFQSLANICLEEEQEVSQPAEWIDCPVCNVDYCYCDCLD